ncbi:MAG: HAD-IIB family hydrolase [Nitrospirota bacterium]
MKRIVVFTDLDGTLLDFHSYSYQKALPAVSLLKEKDIPLVICSSKTKKEIEFYRKKLENHHPFISENGGGIFIPKDYFESDIQPCNPPAPPQGWIKRRPEGFSEDDEYLVIRLGARYSDLRKTIKELRKEGFNVKGFGDMTVQEIAEAANLNIYEAEIAKERDFDEPFVLTEGTDMHGLYESIRAKGFNMTRGRFYHVLGESDKGKAVSILIDLYKQNWGDVTTIALGDSQNDIPMLEKVDYPVLVKKIDGSYDSAVSIPGLIRADGIGPEGWNATVFLLLKKLQGAAPGNKL